MNIVELTCISLSALTIVNLLHILQYLRNWIYPPAQIPCIPILLFTVTLGWGHWAILLNQDYHLEIEYTLNIVKGAVLFCYFFYIKSLLGWEYELNTCNTDKIVPVLTAFGKFPWFLSWCKYANITTELRARRFLSTAEIALYQYMIVICAVFVVGIYVDLALDESNKYSKLLQLIRTISSLAAILPIIGLIILASKVPILKGFGMGVKLIWIKVIMVITEAQPNVLLFLELIGMLKTESSIITHFNSVTVCFEMAFLGFLQLAVFPVSNFKINPESYLELKLVTIER